MDTAIKAGIDAAKTASKRVVQKLTEGTGDLTGNKRAEEITSAEKTKNKGKEKKRWNKWNTKTFYTSRKMSKNIDALSLV